ncbi:MAG: hypothetical protein IJM54_03265 [Thermoguttaceae bacterium]|nr:hypothetical protein [Thermoguttaceae bacterium]MBR4752699.1 hypothetical protein [Thermoguttaceae bacterium]MBR5758103.1 hypothetical protein [Thermoguttaceae bacterium]
MSINSVNGLNGISAANQVSSIKRNNGANAQPKAVERDEMEIKAQQGASRTGESTMNPNDVRIELVNRVRAEIAAGTYYTDEKFEIALTRMFDSFDD